MLIRIMVPSCSVTVTIVVRSAATVNRTTGSQNEAENQLPAAHRPGHDGPHGSVSAATYPAVGLLHGRPRSLTTRPQGGDQPCCASARSQEPRPRPQELPLNPESSHIGEYEPQGSVGRARVWPARRRETLPGLLRHASPPLRQVPRQRERQ